MLNEMIQKDILVKICPLSRIHISYTYVSMSYMYLHTAGHRLPDELLWSLQSCQCLRHHCLYRKGVSGPQFVFNNTTTPCKAYKESVSLSLLFMAVQHLNMNTSQSNQTNLEVATHLQGYIPSQYQNKL